MRRRLAGLFLGAWLGLLSQPASATTAVFLDEVTHATSSTAVVVAEVVKQEVDRHPVYGRARTTSHLAVREVVAGEAPASVALRQLGGELDGKLLHIPGDARIEAGQRGVFFLRQVEGEWYLTAMEQSFYELVPTVGGELLERNVESAMYVRDPSGLLVPRKPEVELPITLHDLKATLAAAGVR